jgi:hypothetical protein
MSQLSQEYIGVTTTARPCYSNLQSYGTGGRSRPIIAPIPVNVQPSLLNLLQPHPLPASMMPRISNHGNDHDGANCKCRCGYKTLDNTCRTCNTKH